MKLAPKSAFGQTVLLIGVLLLINQVVSYLSVTYYFIKPSYEQINSLIATQIAMLEETGYIPVTGEKNNVAFSKSGVKILDVQTAQREGLNTAVTYQFMSAQVSATLEETVTVRISSDRDDQSTNPFVVWVTLEQYPKTWIAIPVKGLNETNLSPLTMYLMVIGFLSVAGGWAFVRRLNRPLQALQKAAKAVGRGQFPPPLEEQGTTEAIQVTRAFNTMNKGIQQLEHDRTLMTAGISHDLRTPLTRIRLASEMLPDDQDWIKDGIVTDIEDMNDIIDQCIDYARLDQHSQTQSTNLNTLIEDIVNARKLEANHQINLDLSSLPTVLLRRVSMKRVLDNLIENAFRYGSETLIVTSFENQLNNTIVCEVRDFGPGIHEEKLDAMFMPFAQGDTARGSAGSGLGLAITKRIVEKHGGNITLSNHPDGGLIASIVLPTQT